MQLDRVHLAPDQYAGQLRTELERAGQHIVFERGNLVGVKGPAYSPVWAENTWLNPRLVPVRSIADAAKALKAMQRNWALYPTLEAGRSRLIQEALPKISGKPHVFGSPVPGTPLGSWTLWERDMLLASPQCTSPFIHGRPIFAEDKTNPPNRAYLKLWESFTRMGMAPGPGDLCLDLGSAPGGWTWVLAELGAHVFSIDKAPLARNVARHPLVHHCIGSAFALEPQHAGTVSWLFSDVACYPERLLALVQDWLEKGQCANFLCTIKFAGETDFATLDQFLSIPNSYAMHLSANKHEVTWVRAISK